MNNSSGKDSFSQRVLCGAHIPSRLDRLSYKASEACLWLSPFSNNIGILKKCILFHLARSSGILILAGSPEGKNASWCHFGHLKSL